MHLALVLTLVVTAPPDMWDFDGLTAKVQAKGATKDRLSAAALTRLGLRLEGAGSLKVSAHANTVGGVTLRIEDPNDAKASCELYATREGDALKFSDSRCTFPAFSGQLRTTATCRRISGTAKRVDDAVELEASAPDCNASPMGVPLSLSGSVSPR